MQALGVNSQWPMVVTDSNELSVSCRRLMIILSTVVQNMVDLCDVGSDHCPSVVPVPVTKPHRTTLEPQRVNSWATRESTHGPPMPAGQS